MAHVCKITQLYVRSGTTREMHAEWSCSESHLDSFEIIWYYYVNGTKYTGSTETKDYQTYDMFSNYTVPDEATSVTFWVKPVSTTYTSNSTEVNYWTGTWKGQTHNFIADKPQAPDAPSIEWDGTWIKAYLEGLNEEKIGTKGVDRVGFNLYDAEKTPTPDYGKTNIQRGWSGIKGGLAWAFFPASALEDSHKYYVVAFYYRTNKSYGDTTGYESDMSEYIASKPKTPTIDKLSSINSTTVKVEFTSPNTYKTCYIQYATRLSAFNTGSSEIQESSFDMNLGKSLEITGLTSGEQYYFRLRVSSYYASEDDIYSSWSNIVACAIGLKPEPPTTWSLQSIYDKDDASTIRGYFVHNPNDSSWCWSYKFFWRIGVGTEFTDWREEEEILWNSSSTGDTPAKDKVIEINIPLLIRRSHAEDWSMLIAAEGSTLYWKVQSKGAIDTYSDDSVEREFKIYANATLSLDGKTTFDTYPYVLTAEAGPSEQTPISYSISVVAGDSYVTTGYDGNNVIVNEGDTLYSTVVDMQTSTLTYSITPEMVTFFPGSPYYINVTVFMNSGRSATASNIIIFSGEGMDVDIDASWSYNSDNCTMSLLPTAKDSDGNLVDTVTLSIYRRNFDGTMTAIITDLPNGGVTYVTDPHPALDYGRYRIVATDTESGANDFYDTPNFPTGETAIIIQWDEDWSNYSTDQPDPMTVQNWTGSFLRLPYNIDITDQTSPDVSLVEYIGREEPTSYYGTQIGRTASWSTDIPATDSETIYQLRRLQRYMGDVYVREPSGSGYWAHIVVSFNKTHNELTIPVSLSITRVSGGV